MSMIRFQLFAAIISLTLGMWAEEAVAEISAWVEDTNSRFRVMIAQMPNGTLRGGIEIQLDPGWHTYWEMPGDSGVPPQFDFSGSTNIRSATTRFPAPQRYQANQEVSVVYLDQVVFPVEIEPENVGEPVRLTVAAFFGVCEVICIPVIAEASVEWTSGQQQSPLARVLVAQFLDRVPTHPSPETLDLALTNRSGDRLEITLTTQEDRPSDLFLVPPPDWFLSQPELKSRNADSANFTVSLAGRPAGAATAGEKLRFVAVSGGMAVEKTITLEE